MEVIEIWNRLEKLKRGQSNILPGVLGEKAVRVIFSQKEIDLLFDSVDYEGVPIYKLRSKIGGRDVKDKQIIVV